MSYLFGGESRQSRYQTAQELNESSFKPDDFEPTLGESLGVDNGDTFLDKAFQAYTTPARLLTRSVANLGIAADAIPTALGTYYGVDNPWWHKHVTQSLTHTAEALTPDPKTTHVALQIADQFVGMLSDVGITGFNPSAYAALEMGKGTTEELEKGKNLSTSLQLGTVRGLTAKYFMTVPVGLASKALPIANRLQGAVSGAAIGTGIGSVSETATQQVLVNSGYPEEAKQHDWSNPQSLALNAAFGAAFGAWHPKILSSHKDALLTANEANAIEHPDGLSATNPAANNALVDGMNSAVHALANGEPVTSSLNLTRRPEIDPELIALAGERLSRGERQPLEQQKADLEYKLKQIEEGDYSQQGQALANEQLSQWDTDQAARQQHSFWAASDTPPAEPPATKQRRIPARKQAALLKAETESAQRQIEAEQAERQVIADSAVELGERVRAQDAQPHRDALDRLNELLAKDDEHRAAHAEISRLEQEHLLANGFIQHPELKQRFEAELQEEVQRVAKENKTAESANNMARKPLESAPATASEPEPDAAAEPQQTLNALTINQQDRNEANAPAITTEPDGTRFGHKVYEGKLVPWLKIWLWGGDGNKAGEFSFPSDTIIKAASKYRPKKPITLYRAHDPNLPDTALQSWTKDKDIASDMADDSDRQLIEKQFDPDQILIDLSMLDKSVQEHTLEHNWDEVIVANGDAIKYVNDVRNGTQPPAQTQVPTLEVGEQGFTSETTQDINAKDTAALADSNEFGDKSDIAMGMPTFKGNKRTVLGMAVNALKTLINRHDITHIDDWFAGGGMWSTSLANAILPNVKSIRLGELNPLRIKRIEWMHERGDKLFEDMQSSGALEVYRKLLEEFKNNKDTDGSAKPILSPSPFDKIGLELAGFGAGKGVNFNRMFTSGADKLPEQGKVLLSALGDLAFNNRSVKIHEASQMTLPDGTVADKFLAKAITEMAAAHKQAQAFKSRGGKYEYMPAGSSFDSVGSKVIKGKHVLSLADPPYYNTTGYKGAGDFATGDKWNANGYAATHDLLQTLVANDNHILYTDEAWWLKAEQMADKHAAGATLTKINNMLSNLYVAPQKIGNRYEQLGIHNPSHVSGQTDSSGLGGKIYAGTAGKGTDGRGSGNDSGRATGPMAERTGEQSRVAAESVESPEITAALTSRERYQLQNPGAKRPEPGATGVDLNNESRTAADDRPIANALTADGFEYPLWSPENDPHTDPDSAVHYDETDQQAADRFMANNPELVDGLIENNYKTALSNLVSSSGWAQTGGQLLRDVEGNAAGRTTWLPNEEWFGRFVKEGLGGDADVKAAVAKFNAGKTLGSKQAKIIDWLKAEVDGQHQDGADSRPAANPRDAVRNRLLNDMEAYQERLALQSEQTLSGNGLHREPAPTRNEPPETSAARDIITSRPSNKVFELKNRDGTTDTGTAAELMAQLDDESLFADQADTATNAAITCFLRFGDL